MMKYKQQIKEYKEEIEKKYLRIEAENRTVKACQNILSESVLSKQSHRTSYFEFLYEQTKFIKKRWWILQGCILMCLWIWLSNYTSDIKDMMRIMGISATIFVVLIVPEIWKNRRNGAIEIEQAVRKLPEEIRETAVLYFFQELKQREIAELLHIKLSLVKYRIGRAKELLMKELEVKNYDEI